jgi:hypothetical protein
MSANAIRFDPCALSRPNSLDCAGWIGLTTPAALLRFFDAMARRVVINFPVRN